MINTTDFIKEYKKRIPPLFKNYFQRRLINVFYSLHIYKNWILFYSIVDNKKIFPINKNTDEIKLNLINTNQIFLEKKTTFVNE